MRAAAAGLGAISFFTITLGLVASSICVGLRIASDSCERAGKGERQR
jgi:hypothetical protein